MLKERESYSVTKGVENEGYEFEIAMLSFYSFQLCYATEITDFKIAIYDDFYHPFDDIVINISSTIEEKYVLQLKHVKDKLHLTSNHFNKNGKFVLNKYFKFDFKKCDHVVLLTNGVVDDELNISHFIIEPKMSLSPMEKILDTCTEDKNHIFKIVNLENHNRITFYTSQKNCHEIDNIIKKKFQEKFLIDDKNLEEIIQKYKKFFQTWKKGDNLCRLDKEDIKMKIAEILFFDHLLEFCPRFVDVIEEKNRQLQKILNGFNVTIINDWSDYLIENLEELCQFEMKKEEIETYGKNFLITSFELKDINIILWRLKKFPLILKINSDNKRMILGLIETFNHLTLPFILVGSHISPLDIKKGRVFANLTDLINLNCGDYVIDNLKMSIQGGDPLTIKELLQYNQKFSEIVTMRELLLMLKDNFFIGEKKAILPQPYISRHLLTKLIKIESLKQISRDIFIITGSAKQFNFVRNKLKEKKFFDLHFYYGKIANDEPLPSRTVILTEEPMVSVKNKTRNVHHLKIIDDKYLQWVTSKENSDDLKKLTVVFKEDELYENLTGTINLVCARPGMGKSTMLTYLKNECPQGYWSVKKNFKEYQIETNPENQSDFTTKTMECFEEVHRLIYFFYGIESLQNDGLVKAIQSIKELSRRGFKVWIFSEDHLREKLERMFDVASMDIEEFHEDQQQEYIKERVKEVDIDQGLEKIMMCFKSLKNDILGAPMHLFMLTEIFINYPKKDMEDIFILTDIYHCFMTTKYRHYLSKFGCCQHNQIIEDGIHYRTQQYKIAAMLCLPEMFRNSSVKCDRDFLKQIKEKGDFLRVISKVNEHERIIFSQQTYVDYFAALWLASNYHQVVNLKEFMFREDFKNIQFMFNLELVKNHPAHVAVLYKNFDQLLKHRDKLEELDQVGRSPLHLVCSYGIRCTKLEMIIEDDYFKFKEKETEKEDEEIKKIIDFLIDNVSFDPWLKDNLLQWDLVIYAMTTLNLYALEKIMMVHKELSLDIFKFDDLFFSILYYSIKFGYENLLKLVVQTGIFQRILKMKNYNGETLLHLAVKSGHTPIVAVLINQGADINAIASTHHKHSPLHLAVYNCHHQIVELLLEKGADIESMDKCRSTPLHLAACRGDIRSLKLLQKYGAEINSCDNFGRTPLHRAAAEGHVLILRFLLSHGAKINRPDKLGTTPVQCAINQKHSAAINILLRKGAEDDCTAIRKKSITSDPYDGYVKYPLHWAAIIGHAEDTERLLRDGYDIDDLDNLRRTPLHWAVIRKHNEMVKVLLKFGADVNITDKNQITPLYWAINNKDIETVDLFLGKNAKLDIKDRFGYSPLHWAAMDGNHKLIRRLLTKNPDLEISDNFGRKPLDWAVEMGHQEAVELLNQEDDPKINETVKEKFDFLTSYESILFNINDNNELSSFLCAANLGNVNLVQKFLDQKRNVNECDGYGYTALYRAVVNKHPQVVQLLLDNDAEIDCRNGFNSTPLHWVALVGNLKMVKLLLEHHARIHVVDDFGYNPLHFAAMKGYFQTLNLLLEAGGDVNIADKYGNTPLDWAVRKGHYRTVKALLEKGAVGISVQENFLEIAEKQNKFFKQRSVLS